MNNTHYAFFREVLIFNFHFFLLLSETQESVLVDNMETSEAPLMKCISANLHY